MKWTVETLNQQVLEELDALPDDMQAKYHFIAGMIEDFGPSQVGMPHLRHIEGRLWELRLKGRDGIARALYVVVTGRKVVIVRVFIKKTSKTPRHEIDLALSRANQIL